MVELSYEQITVESNEGVTRVAFNRPDKRNAMSPTLHREMHDALTKLEHDQDTRVLVVTGVGDAFSAGMDLKQFFYEQRNERMSLEEIYRVLYEWSNVKLYHFSKPTIAMVNGHCFGGALTVVGSCDIAIAADDAVFGLPEINFGTIPGGLVARMVAEFMHPRQAMYYVLTGERFTGRQAVDIGYVTQSVPRSDLEARVDAVAAMLLEKDHLALRACKETFKEVDLRSLSHYQAWRWLDAKLDQLTLLQGKPTSWLESGVGGFVKKEFRPGVEAAPGLNSQ